MVEKRITLPYGPRRTFEAYHRRLERWAVLVVHRRAGKTVACINDLIKRALTLQISDGRYAYVAPYLAQAKEVAWEYLKRFARPVIADKNEAELWVELINGARIRIHGADNPDRLRGAYLDGVVLDEYADMRPGVWGEIIRPMLTDRQGWATFIGTPKGRNEFYRVYQGAQQHQNWFSMLVKASESGILPSAELEDARGDMTPEQFEQEFECSFDAAILGAYYGSGIAELERAGRICDVPYDPALPCFTSWDLGMSDSTAIFVWQPSFDGLRLIDHYENHSQPLLHYTKELDARGYAITADFLPHDARVREQQTGRSRIEYLQSLGRKVLITPNLSVIDGINAARVSLPKMWIDQTRCAAAVEAIRQHRAHYDEKKKAFSEYPLKDWTSDTADAFRYVALAWRQLVTPKVKAVKPKELVLEAAADGSVIANMSIKDFILEKERKRKRDRF